MPNPTKTPISRPPSARIRRPAAKDKGLEILAIKPHGIVKKAKEQGHEPVAEHAVFHSVSPIRLDARYAAMPHEKRGAPLTN